MNSGTNALRLKDVIMNFFTDPNVAYLLLVGGFLLAILALFAPGTGLIELAALILLVLAGFSIASQTFNLWAVIVLILGVIPFILALRFSRRWIFLAISLVALTVGSAFLVTTPNGMPAVNPVLALVNSVLVGGFIWFIGHRMLAALAAPVVNKNNVVGKIGEARTDILNEGSAYVGGEEWSARSASFIPAGCKVIVKSQEGLTVTVERQP
jgi:membrane-bound ClpP family serine protease